MTPQALRMLVEDLVKLRAAVNPPSAASEPPAVAILTRAIDALAEREAPVRNYVGYGEWEPITSRDRLLADAIDAFGRACAAEALAKVADDVAAMPRFAVDGDRRGRMLQWPHGEFLYREHVIEAITLPATTATSTPEERR